MLKRQMARELEAKIRENRELAATLSLTQDKMVALVKQRDNFEGELGKQRLITLEWEQRFDALLYHGYKPAPAPRVAGKEGG